MNTPPMSGDTRGVETYKSAADCPLGAAHGMASTHHNAADEWVCDWCGFPVVDALATPTSNVKDNPDD